MRDIYSSIVWIRDAELTWDTSVGPIESFEIYVVDSQEVFQFSIFGSVQLGTEARQHPYT